MLCASSRTREKLHDSKGRSVRCMGEGGEMEGRVQPLQVSCEQSSDSRNILGLHGAEGIARLIRHLVELDCSGESHSRPEAREVHLRNMSSQSHGERERGGPTS
jgi:hypothetical protein